MSVTIFGMDTLYPIFSEHKCDVETWSLQSGTYTEKWSEVAVTFSYIGVHY